MKEYIYDDPKYDKLIISYFDESNKKMMSKATTISNKYPYFTSFRDVKEFVPFDIELEHHTLRYFNFTEVLKRHQCFRFPYRIVGYMADEIKTNPKYKEFFESSIEKAYKEYGNSHAYQNLEYFIHAINKLKDVYYGN